jgi:broad specificity phosphatase PhoE
MKQREKGILLNEIDTTGKAAFALLIRHAEREPITDGEAMYVAPLTERGKADARQLGRSLKGHRLNAFFSSPVPRCVETNVSVLEGLGFDTEEARQRARPHPVLAEAYMEDFEKARRVFKLADPEQIILDYTSGMPVPGFGTIERGAKALLDFIRENVSEGTLSVFVTHDALIMPFKRHFQGTSYTRDNWLTFLDGCVIRVEGQEMYIS